MPKLEIPTMIDNKKEEYAHVINSYTKNSIEGLIPKRIVPFDYYEERGIDKEVKNWIERSEGEFAVVVGDAGFGKTNLLCNLANELLKEEHYAVFFVKSENLRGNDFDKKILDDLEITKTGINAFLREIMDEKIIFLLDTLDVIATDDGIARLDDFLTKVKGENRVVIGASRPLEFKRINHLTRKSFELKPFSDDEIRRLFDKYKAFYEMEGAELKPPVLEVCRNPLHMRMLFDVYQPDEIPEDINTQKLYDKYWDKKVAEIRIGALSHLDAGKKRKAEELKEDLAKNMASEMLASNLITLSKSNIENIKGRMQEDYSKIQYAEVKNSTDVTITQTIKELIIEYDTLIDDVYHDLLDEGVLRLQADLVEFFHQSFFEYAAARALIEKEDAEQLEYLLNNTTLLENRRIIQQVILYAKKKKKDEMAYKFLKTLSETNLYTKILAIDLLKDIENISEKDVEIYQSLKKDEIGIREYLAESLKDIIPKHPRVASGLIETLCRDENWTVRRVVAEALPELFEVNPELATALIETLSRDEDWSVRWAATGALPKLVEINPEVATALAKSLSGDRWTVRWAVAEALPELFEVKPELATALIGTLSRDEDYFVRRTAAKALPKFVEVNPEVAIGLVETLSKDDDALVRGATAEVLAKLFEVKPEVVTGLIKSLSEDEECFVLRATARARAKLVEVNPEVASRFETLGRDKDEFARGSVAVGPSKLAELLKAVTAISKTLSGDKDRDVRGTAASALPALVKGNPEVATKLVKTLSRDNDASVRYTVACALIELIEVNPEVETGLIETLSRDKDSVVRRVATEALLKLAVLYPQRAYPLVERLKDVEYIEIQKAIAEIVRRGLLRDKDGEKRMRKQNIEINGSQRVKSTQRSNGNGSQNLKVVDSEDVESEQIIGKEKDKTTYSPEISENIQNKTLKKSAESVQRYCQKRLRYIPASDDIYFRFFTDHTPSHSQTILKILKELLFDLNLKNDYEYYLLYTAAYAHDIGMLPQKTNGGYEDYTKQEVVEEARKEHSMRSAEHIKRNWREIGILEKTHSVHLAEICKAHSSKVAINNIPERAECVIDGSKVEIRWRFLAALIRLADALDADYNRIPPEFIIKNAKLSEKTVREYLKHESVQKVTVSHRDRKIYVDLLLPDKGAMHEIKEELKKHLVGEFESVKAIINGYGMKIEKIEFLETVSSEI